MLKTISTLGFLGMVGGLAGLIGTDMLFSSSSPVIVTQIAAVLLMVWARVVFGRRSFHAAANPTAGELVTVGPYRYVRHPIYAAACLFTVAGVATYRSWTAAALCGLVLVGALVRLRCEEVLLAVRFPQYHDYAAKTWRMIPYVF
jgi:protein-S-isoprenylcysteine O-methyltransferase Ste14